jgi:hypothetical protein
MTLNRGNATRQTGHLNNNSFHLLPNCNACPTVIGIYFIGLISLNSQDKLLGLLKVIQLVSGD